MVLIFSLIPLNFLQSVELEQLAVYLDSDIIPWHISKPWKELLPFEWSQVYIHLCYTILHVVSKAFLVHYKLNYYFFDLQIFRYGTKDGRPADAQIRKHNYILQPVTGNAKYSKQRQNESANSGQPLQKASVNLDDVTLCLSKVDVAILSLNCST